MAIFANTFEQDKEPQKLLSHTTVNPTFTIDEPTYGSQKSVNLDELLKSGQSGDIFSNLYVEAPDLSKNTPKGTKKLVSVSDYVKANNSKINVEDLNAVKSLLGNKTVVDIRGIKQKPAGLDNYVKTWQDNKGNIQDYFRGFQDITGKDVSATTPGVGREISAGILGFLSGLGKEDKNAIPNDIKQQQMRLRWSNLENSFSNKFQSNQQVKDYAARIGFTKDLMELAKKKDPLSDIAMIYKYMKALDPTSVVRESEVGMVVSSASIPQWIQNKINGWLGKEKLSDDQRQDMVESAKANLVSSSNIVSNLRQGYESQLNRQTSGELANYMDDIFNLPPAEVTELTKEEVDKIAKQKGITAAKEKGIDKSSGKSIKDLTFKNPDAKYDENLGTWIDRKHRTIFDSTTNSWSNYEGEK